MSGTRYCDSDIEKMRTMAEDGRTDEEIANALGRNVDGLHRKRVPMGFRINVRRRHERCRAEREQAQQAPAP